MATTATDDRLEYVTNYLLQAALAFEMMANGTISPDEKTLRKTADYFRDKAARYGTA